MQKVAEALGLAAEANKWKRSLSGFRGLDLGIRLWASYRAVWMAQVPEGLSGFRV